MALTKNRKWMAGVLGVCVLALAGDRLFFLEKTDGKQAVATDLLVEEPAAATTQRSEKLVRWGSRTAEARLTAAMRLRAKELALAKDIFRPQIEQAVVKAADAKSVTPVYDAAAVFIAEHKLTAVIRNGNSSVAIVGTQFVHVGEGVAGFKLVALESKAAIFERPGVRVRLTLSEPEIELSELK